MEDFKDAGVQLVAVSPEVPDQTLTTKERNELEFEDLSDVGTSYAKKLGIMWQLPEYVMPSMVKFGHDFKKIYGNEVSLLNIGLSLSKT